MRLKHLFFFILIVSIAGNSCKKDDLPVYEYRKLGASAHDLLSDQTYTALEIQMNYMPGYEPTDSVINVVKSYLQSLIKKPVGISFYPTLFTSVVSSPISLNNVVALEPKVRTYFTRSQTIAVHIMIVDAEYQSKDILGISYWNTSMCVFGKTINRFSGRPGLVTRNQLMITLLEHELGHLLGLVDQGTPMVTPHRDSYGAHCNNSSCLMNYLIETSSSGYRGIPQLDNNCRTDLTNNGGK